MSDMYQNIMSQTYVLASKSPRRAQLLQLLGLTFKVIPSHVNEDEIREIDPPNHVTSLSTAKAISVGSTIEAGIIIGSDTIVVIDEEILGKPRDEQHAKTMLKRLSGRYHKVYTGFTLLEKPSHRKLSDYEVTRVHFRDLSDWEIDAYVAGKSPMDKAGAYGIQDQSAVFVDRIEGCFYNVVGFPLSKFYQNLKVFLLPEMQHQNGT